MADSVDLLASLGLDISAYQAGLDQAAAASQAFVAAQVASFATLTLAAPDSSAYSASLQAAAASTQTVIAANADLAVSQDVVSQASAVAAAAMDQQTSAQSDDAAATVVTTQALQDQVSALQAQVDAQAETIAGLRQHGAASSDAAKEASGLRQETSALATDALPALSGNLGVVNGLLSATRGAFSVATDEEVSFTASTAAMGAGLTAAGVGAAAVFFGVFDSGLTTLKLTATQFGLTIPQVAGLNAELQSVGLPASAATTGLRMLSTGLQTMQTQINSGAEPTGRLQQGLAAIGLSGRDASGNMLPMATLLPEILTNFKATADAAAATGASFDAAGVAGELLGSRTGSQMVPALLEGGQALADWTAQAKALGIGSADELAHLEALHIATATASLDFQGMAMQIGSDVAPAVTLLVGMLGSAATGFAQLSPPLRDAVITFPLVTGGALLAVSGLKALYGVGQTVVASFRAIVPAMQAAAVAEGEEAAAAVGAEVATASIVPALGIIIGLGAALAIGLHALSAGDDAAAASAAAHTKAIKDASDAIGGETAALQAQGLTNQQVYSQLASEQDQASIDIQKNAAIRTQLQGQFVQQAAVQLGLGKNITVQQAEQAASSGLLASKFAPVIAGLEQQSSAYQLAGAAQDAATGKAKSLEAQMTALQPTMQQDASATTAASSVLQTLAANLGFVDIGELTTAQAVQTLDAAIQSQSKSTSDGIAFTQAQALAQSDVALSADDWATKLAQLTELTKGHDEALKLEAQDEIDLGNAMRDTSSLAVDLSVAVQGAEAEMTAMSSATKQLDADIQTTSTTSAKFNTDLLAGAETASSQWADLYGTAAQQIAQSMQDSSSAAALAWQTADATVLSDEQQLTGQMTDEARKQLEAKLSADQQISDAARTTAQNQIDDENAYTAAVLKNANDNLSYQKQMYDNTLKMSHENEGEKETDLAKWLQAENDEMNAILQLEVQFANATDEITRQTLQDQIDMAKQALAVIQAAASEAQTLGQYNQQDITASIKAGKAATAGGLGSAGISNAGLDKAQVADINAQTAAVNELTAAQKAGADIQKQDLDLTKEVGASKQLATQSQLDGLHSVTEAARGTATAELLATSQAQQAYLATAAAANGQATAEVNQAKATYAAKKQISDQGVTDFNDALAAETTAQSVFDSQQQASAKAQDTLHKDAASSATALTAAQSSLTAAVVTGQGQISSASVAAAQASLEGWQTANAAVLADEQQLTGDMSDADRKRLSDKLATDQGILADAKTTSTESAKAVASEAAAVKGYNADVLADRKNNDALALASAKINAVGYQDLWLVAGQDVTASVDATQARLTTSNNAAVASYQQAAAAVTSVEQQLTGNLSDQERARLNAVLVVDQGIAADRLQTAQAGLTAAQTYVDGFDAAESKIISLQQTWFDAGEKLRNLTVYEQQAGLAQWLQAEQSTTSQIAALEAQLATETSTVDQAVTNQKIADLQLVLQAEQESAHEAEAFATDLQNAAQAAAAALSKVQSAASSAGSAISGAVVSLSAASSGAAAVATSVGTITTAAQAATTALTQMTGVLSTPSTEEDQLQVQASQLQLTMAQQQEGGMLSTNPLQVQEQAKLTLITDQITAYANERKATEDLATAQAALTTGTSNSITTMRSLQDQLTSLAGGVDSTGNALTTFTSTSGQVIQAWAAAANGAISSVAGTASQAAQSAAASGVIMLPGGGYETAGEGASNPYGPNAGAPNGSLAAFLQSGGNAGGGSYSGGTQNATFDNSVPASLGAEGTSMNAFMAGLGIKSYGLGTSFVPEDQLAFLHRGEAVIPPELNQGQQGASFRGGGGPVSLTVQNNLYGTNLTLADVNRVTTAAAQSVLNNALGRGATLAGIRTS